MKYYLLLSDLPQSVHQDLFPVNAYESVRPRGWTERIYGLIRTLRRFA
ncbi:hypothetical protein PTE30175_00564 [Pandoraea terrae]|uniref:Uncharacterized protein n=1 Tax=Pandoraea terrae TaxID=1537710 RepID=A0A5E4S9S3_9BURK|nr:hypothetical protein [Pandoraea terrae]VVD70968.1 hypothetical protein PTE30175_00564 [Pandoraea terrae]